MQVQNSVLIVDDDPNVVSALMRELDEEPYTVTGASGAEEALGLMMRQRFKVVISDEMMPNMNGAEFLARVRTLYPETVRIMLTGHASVEATMRAVNRGEIYRFFTKPWDCNDFKLALRGALEKYDLERENELLLRTVRRQSQELKFLEQHFPGITEIRRDRQGAIRIDREPSDDEVAEIIASYSS